VSLAGRAVGGSAERPAQRPGPEVVIEPGQTLWSIARARIGPQGDPRPLIQDIRELNGMATSELQVGQQLVLPAVD
jgi:LysM repeat protein